jgi:AraC family transcriptional regulator
MSNALRVAHGEFGRVALLDMDRHLVRHAHPHCHVLLKVEGADTAFAVRDDVVPLTDESAVVVNAWEPHAYVHDPSRPRTVILALYIKPVWLRSFRPNWVASGSPGFFERSVGAVTPRIRSLTLDLATAMIHEPNSRDRHETLLANLMIAVIERFTPWRSAALSCAAMAARTRWDPRIRKAIAMMRNNVEAITDMATLARDAGMSRASFFRAFEAAVQTPPRVFFNMLRMEMAVAAAIREQENFTAISERLGFSAPAHFTRFFRDHAGATPSEFRTVAGLARAA